MDGTRVKVNGQSGVGMNFSLFSISWPSWVFFNIGYWGLHNQSFLSFLNALGIVFQIRLPVVIRDRAFQAWPLRSEHTVPQFMLEMINPHPNMGKLNVQ